MYDGSNEQFTAVEGEGYDSGMDTGQHCEHEVALDEPLHTTAAVVDTDSTG